MFNNNIFGGASIGDKLGEQIVTSPVLQIDFDNIHQTFTHLMIIMSGRTDTPALPVEVVRIRFNDDNDNNYVNVNTLTRSTGIIYNHENNVNAIAFAFYPAVTANANMPGFSSALIFNYSKDVFYKHIQSDSRIITQASLITGSFFQFYYGVWKNTIPITKISIFCTNSSNFIVGSQFSLYGVN